MEQLFYVRFDTDYIPTKRLVRSHDNFIVSGCEVEVDISNDGGSPRWRRCRAERWVGRQLWVSAL